MITVILKENQKYNIFKIIDLKPTLDTLIE